MAVTLLGISGSLRKESVNRKLVREAARLYGPCTYVEADLNLQLYDGDLQDSIGLPTPVQTLVDQIAQADGIIIATPEYNGGVTGVLKNALDWVSRSKPHPWTGKPVAVMSAASGRAGGVRAQTMLRTCLAPFNVRLALSSEVAIAGASNEFDDDGQLLSERYQAALTKLMDALQSDIARGH